MEEIKILAINTSPRKGRNTQQLAEAVLDGCRSLNAQELDVGSTETGGISSASAGSAENNGVGGIQNGGIGGTETGGLQIATEMIQVGDAPADGFQLCRGCWGCVKKGSCVLKDDFVTEIYEKIRQADGVIFASPVFFCDVSTQCKIIMDRSLGLIPLGAGKASAAAITCGSVGVNSALHTIQGFCSMQGFLDAGWVATYGKTEDKIRGREVAHALGRKLVRLAVMTRREMAGAQATGDAARRQDLSHCNHFAYGTHTF